MVNIPQDLLYLFKNPAGAIDLEKVALWISKSLNKGLFMPIYGLVIAQNAGPFNQSLDLYQRFERTRILIGRVTVVLTPQLSYLGFFGNNDQWEENTRYFNEKIKEEIARIIVQTRVDIELVMAQTGRKFREEEGWIKEFAGVRQPGTFQPPRLFRDAYSRLMRAANPPAPLAGRVRQRED